jgi:DNA-binding NarL/FixJ family response regulator
MNRITRILIADHDGDFTQSLSCFLGQYDEFKIVAVAHDGPGVLTGCRDTLPDVVLMGLHLPVLDSVRTIRAVLAQNDRVKILGLAAGPDDRYAVEAVKAGALGCVEKQGQNGCLAIVEAIRQVVDGDVLLNPALASSILQEFHRIAQ